MEIRKETDNGKLNMTGKKDMCFVAGTMLDNVRGQLNESGLGSENDFCVGNTVQYLHSIL
jgi:hypothetical protein